MRVVFRDYAKKNPLKTCVMDSVPREGEFVKIYDAKRNSLMYQVQYVTWSLNEDSPDIAVVLDMRRILI